MPRLALLLFACALTLGVAVSCGSDDPIAGGESGGVTIPDDAVDHTGQTTVTVNVTDNKYEDRTIVVDEGTEVVWVNKGLNQHNVISSDDTFEELPTEVFDDPGEAAMVFDTTGNYPYYCSIHGTPNNGQRGEVVVVAAAT